MRIRLTPSLFRRGMTLVEVVVVIGIISIALPALFSTLIVSTRQQVSISRINEVKNQGDSVLGVMTSRIKSNANRLCVTSAADTSCVTEVCGSTTASPTDMNSFIDRASVLTRYYLKGTSIYESTGGTEKRLTNDLVKVNSLVIQCHKTSQTTRPIISIQYTVIAEPLGNTNVSERATLDYSTKIIVDQVDPIAQSVSDIAPGDHAVATPTPTLTPSHSPTPSATLTPSSTPTFTPTPTLPTTGDCTKSIASRTGWTATADSQQNTGNASANAAIDSNNATYWHSQFSPTLYQQPHWIRIDLGTEHVVECLKYLPRQSLNDGGYTNGRIVSYQIYISNVASSNVADWGTSVATGSLSYDSNNIDRVFSIVLRPQRGRYVILRSLSAVNGNAWTTAAEINLVTSVVPPPTVYHTVAGHVTDTLSGAAISDVALTIEYTPAGATSTSTTPVWTDASGYFTLSNTVPINTLYAVRMQPLTGSNIGKEGYSNPELTAPPERIYGTINLYHTYRHDTPTYRDSQTSDTSYERQYAGQSDCASAIASGWNYPAGRCDFRLAAVVVPTPTPARQYWYYQTFLSRDGSNKYTRSCPINTSTGIVFASCSLLIPEGITNLRGTSNERYSDWASTVYTLPTGTTYDAPEGESTRALLPVGTQVLITTLLSTDGTSTYTRSCPLNIANSSGRCWPRSWAATTAAAYNLGNVNFGDGAGKTYVGIDFVAYPKMYGGVLRQAFRRWFVRSDALTYIIQQCYIKTSISYIGDPNFINWTTECTDDNGTVGAYMIRNRTTETTSGFPQFHAEHTGVPTMSTVIYPKGSIYEMFQAGLNSVGDWGWYRTASADPYYGNTSGLYNFPTVLSLTQISDPPTGELNTNFRGIDGYVVMY